MSTEYADRFSMHFIIVDDGSTDDSGDVAEQLGHDLDTVVLRHGVNQGPGYAFGTAFEYLMPHVRDNMWVLTCEGDNTSRLTLLSQMFQRSQEGYQAIFASPYMYGGRIVNTDPFRVFLSNIANTFVKEFLQIYGILTVSSFFRLYRGEVIQNLQSYYGPRILEQRGFESMVEMTIKMVHLNTTISEVPMVLDTSLRRGKSKMKIARTIRGYITCWLKMGRWRAATANAAPLSMQTQLSDSKVMVK